MALRGQGEWTYRARSDATAPSPPLRASEEEHHHTTHTQLELHTSTATKLPKRDREHIKILLYYLLFKKQRAVNINNKRSSL